VQKLRVGVSKISVSVSHAKKNERGGRVYSINDRQWAEEGSAEQKLSSTEYAKGLGHSGQTETELPPLTQYSILATHTNTPNGKFHLQII
jgi:hypothetical protein